MTDDEKREAMEKARTHPAYREGCVRAHLSRDKAMCLHLEKNGIDPYDQFMRFDPHTLIGRWVQLNDGALVNVREYDAYYGIIICQRESIGEITYPLTVWLMRTLGPKVMPEGWSP